MLVARGGPLVTGGDHEHNPGVLYPAVHPVHHLVLRGEAAGHAQAHVDDVYAQLHGVLQSRQNPHIAGSALCIGEHLEDGQLRIRRHTSEGAAVGGNGARHMGAVTLYIVDIGVPIGIVVGEGNFAADVDLVQVSLGVEIQVFHGRLHIRFGHGLHRRRRCKGLMVHIQAGVQNTHQHAGASVIPGDMNHTAGAVHIGLCGSYGRLRGRIGLGHLNRPDARDGCNGLHLPKGRRNRKAVEQQAVCIHNFQPIH